jgi:hypothetical protein
LDWRNRAHKVISRVRKGGHQISVRRYEYPIIVKSCERYADHSCAAAFRRQMKKYYFVKNKLT